jgi:hypothetical protein
MLISSAAAAGTKIQTAFPIAAIVVLAAVLLAMRRIRLDRRWLAILVLALPIGTLLLGGWPYLLNLQHTGKAAVPASSTNDAGYGDWTNLLEVPAMILLRPFDSSEGDLYVPWRGERWFWPRYELFFSDYGKLVSLLVLATPFALLRYRSRGALPIRRERVITSILAAMTFVLMLPIRIRPLGFFAGFPRYFCFIAVFILVWTVVPAVRELAVRRKRRLVHAACAISATFFIAYAVEAAINDRFQPIEYVSYVVDHPGFRLPAFATYRAATIVDQIAGPEDTIAIHAGFDSWIYPLYGRDLRRKVIFVEPSSPIPPEARWVLVDRTWNIIWGDPRFKTTGQYEQYLTKGLPSDEDVALVKRLMSMPDRYETIYFFKRRNQAVFERRGAVR